jgi:hypothetical protein
MSQLGPKPERLGPSKIAPLSPQDLTIARVGEETLAICRTLALARAAFEVAIAAKPAGRFMIRSRTRVVKRHPEGDCSRSAISMARSPCGTPQESTSRPDGHSGRCGRHW